MYIYFFFSFFWIIKKYKRLKTKNKNKVFLLFKFCWIKKASIYFLFMKVMLITMCIYMYSPFMHFSKCRTFLRGSYRANSRHYPSSQCIFWCILSCLRCSQRDWMPSLWLLALLSDAWSSSSRAQGFVLGYQRNCQTYQTVYDLKSQFRLWALLNEKYKLFAKWLSSPNILIQISISFLIQVIWIKNHEYWHDIVNLLYFLLQTNCSR